MKHSTKIKNIRVCRTKKKYTKDYAYGKSRRLNKEGHYLHAYQCPNCNVWHIGHLKKRVRLQIAFNKLEKGINNGEFIFIYCV